MENTMNELGHNQPPGMIDTAGEVAASLGKWMEDHPVIRDEVEAREAKTLIDRAKLCVKDMEAEREGKVKPLNLKVAEINDRYRRPRGFLQNVQHELVRRITSYLGRIEAEKLKAAEEAHQKAAEAARIALAAEAREKELMAEADQGVVVDVPEATHQANESFSAYQKAKRQADLAERETKVRIGGGISRSLGLKNKETLVVEDAVTAINAIGMTPDLEAAILKGARAYRTIHGELPDGVGSKMERSA
jgi:predicted phage tail protein